MKTFFRSLALLLLVLQTSCSQINFMVINLPTHFQDTQVISNVSYGPREDEKLDIYLPKTQADISSYPVVVFFYGGRWETGEKEEYAFVADALVRANFIVVIPNYRKYPDVKFPAFIEDAAAAIAWTSDHISQYGGDPTHLNIAGHSASLPGSLSQIPINCQKLCWYGRTL
jgi:acetyl esterase/lipase